MISMQSIKSDTCLLLIGLFVVGTFGAAGALTYRSNTQLHSRQCDIAETWLYDSADNADLFENARTMENIDSWLAAQDELNAPSAANQLKWAIMDSARNTQEANPLESTSTDRVLYNPLYAARIDYGVADIIDHCPNVEALLPHAFPMVFGKENDE